MTESEIQMVKLVRESDVIDRTDGSELAQAFNYLFDKYVETQVPEKECCATCKHNAEIWEWDYTDVRNKGVPKTKLDGYGCLGGLHENIVVQMVGENPATGMCEMYWEREHDR